MTVTVAPNYHRTADGIILYDSEAFEGMRRAGRIAAQALDMIAPEVQPGVSTEKLNQLLESFIRDHGATPAPLGYRGFPKATCISVNHVICHGIPSSKTLKDGDILNIDVTAILDGWHGDTSRMFNAGNVKRKAKRLIEITHECLIRGITAVKPGAHFGDIGAAIQSYAEAHRCSVVEDFCGHGLGRNFHEAPNVFHYGKAGTGPKMEVGMIFTIEPMINLGKAAAFVLADGWTAITRDRTLSAQFEHSLAVTETGYELFTESPAGTFYPANAS